MPGHGYDEVPYGSLPFPQSHPDRLATVAALMGLAHAPVERCRVLEIGCASGGNLLPMAEGLPNSSFVGIDLSARQINEASTAAEALGLRNLQLHRMDLAEAGPELGDFDYIISHGVFSWVDRPTQERLLAFCGTRLAPDGIAYISYNTLPGWGMRGAVRDLMLFHAGSFHDPREQVERSVEILDLLARAGEEGAPFSIFLRSEADRIRRTAVPHVLHEFLEGHNDPVYFHEFLRRAAAHGLAYVGEAEVQAMMPPARSPEIHQELLRLAAGGQARLEQYLDFVRCRAFRQTLLCRADRQVDYASTPLRVAALHIASPVNPAGIDLAPGAEMSFGGPNGVLVKSREPLIKAALVVLSERWPASLPFAELCRLARQRAGPPEGDDARQLAEALWRFHAAASALELTTRPHPAPPRPSAKPMARLLARWQAARGERAVTGLRHDAVYLRQLERQVLCLLDGTRDAAAVIDALATMVASGELAIQQDGRALADPQAVRAALSLAVGRLVEQFTRQGLLAG